MAANVLVFTVPSGIPSEVRRAAVPAAHPLLAADRVDGSVVHQGQEEGAERAPYRVVGLGRPPQGQETVVHHVLRERRLAREAVRQPVGGGGVPSVQLVEGALLTTDERPVQLHVVAGVVLHAPVLAARHPADPGG